MSITHPKEHLYPTSIILRKFEGKVNEKEIMASWQELEDQNRFTKDIKGVLNDLDDCELTMSLDGFRDLMYFMLLKEHLRRVRIAVVTNSIKNIVFPSLGEVQFRELNIKPFSTIDAAVDWILS